MKSFLTKSFVLLLVLSIAQATHFQVQNSTSLTITSSNIGEVMLKFQKFFKKFIQYLIYLLDNHKYSKIVQEIWSNANQDLLFSVISFITYASSVLGFTFYWFPELRNAKYWQVDQIENIGRFARSIEEMSITVNKAIDQYSNVKPEICVKMALCTLGKSKMHKRIPRNPTIDVINTVLNLPGLNEMILQNKEYRDSHSYGLEGNDCDKINKEGNCPFNADTWVLLLSRLARLF